MYVYIYKPTLFLNLLPNVLVVALQQSSKSFNSLFPHVVMKQNKMLQIFKMFNAEEKESNQDLVMDLLPTISGNLTETLMKTLGKGTSWNVGVLLALNWICMLDDVWIYCIWDVDIAGIFTPEHLDDITTEGFSRNGSQVHLKLSWHWEYLLYTNRCCLQVFWHFGCGISLCDTLARPLSNVPCNRAQ